MDAKELGAQSAGQEIDSQLTFDDYGNPFTRTYSLGGLTKRELFAAMVMQGIASDPSGIKSYEWMAETSVKWADALLAELTKE